MKRSRSFWIVAAFAALWLLISCAFAFPMYGQTTKPVAPMVWYQPAYKIPQWKDCGITVYYGIDLEGVNTPAQLATRIQALKDAKMKVILGDFGKAYWNDDVCAGIICGKDEPDAAGGETAEQQKADADLIRTVTNKDRYVTLNAGTVLQKTDAIIAAYCANVEKIGVFSYPVNFGMGTAGILSETGPAIDKIRRLAPGKSIFLITEAGDQDMKANHFWGKQPAAANMRGPTGDEMAMSCGVAISRGANGIMYFTQKIGDGWEGFDSSTPDIRQAMKYINAYAATQLVVTVTHDVPVPAAQPATQPVGGYGQAYVHLRTRDGGKTWYIAVP